MIVKGRRRERGKKVGRKVKGKEDARGEMSPRSIRTIEERGFHGS